MPRFKNVNGVRIQLTAQEEIVRDAQEKAWSDDAVNRAFIQLRRARNTIIAETDWLANSFLGLLYVRFISICRDNFWSYSSSRYRYYS